MHQAVVTWSWKTACQLWHDLQQMIHIKMLCYTLTHRCAPHFPNTSCAFCSCDKTGAKQISCSQIHRDYVLGRADMWSISCPQTNKMLNTEAPSIPTDFSGKQSTTYRIKGLMSKPHKEMDVVGDEAMNQEAKFMSVVMLVDCSQTVHWS